MSLDVKNLTPEQRSTLLAQLTSGGDPFPELATLIDQKATERANALVAAAQRKAETNALAARLVGGTAENPHGLPVDKDQLAAFLLSLSPEQQAQAETFLKTIQEKGVVPFAELGNGGVVTGQLSLPAEYAAKLDAEQMTVEDLKNPVLGLGDLAQYNLTKWQKGK